MSYVDTADDELDYGEEDLGEQNKNATSFQPIGAIPAITDDEMVQEEAYEDLYDDVNIGYFPVTAEPSIRRTADEGEGFGGDYGEEEAYYGTGTRVSGILHGKEQISRQKVAGLEQSGDAKFEEVYIPVRFKEDDQVSSLSLPQPVEKPRDSIEKRQRVNLRSTAVTGAMHREGIPFGFEAQDNDGSSTRASLTQKEPQDGTCLGQAAPRVGLALEKLTTLTQAKEEGDSLSTSPLELHADKSYSLQKRGGRGNDALVPGSGDSLVSIAPVGRGTGYDALGMGGRAPTGGLPRMVGRGHVRGRGGAAGMSRGAGKVSGPSLPRSSQCASQKDSISNLGNNYPARHGGQAHAGQDREGSMLFVGELNWWTTDAELEAALSEFGRIKNLKFFEERASGKSKGYCQVVFYDHATAVACKEKMNGRKFNDRPCLVAFANSRTILTMGNAQVNKAQAQSQVQTPFRRGINDAGGPRGGSLYQGGESSRSHGKLGTGVRAGHGQGIGSKGGQIGPGRSRGSMGGKSMSSGIVGGGDVGGVPYGQGLPGPIGGHPSGMMIPKGIMGQGYDPIYGPPMGRGGAGYGGYVMPGPPFPGMVASFPNMGHGGLPGVAPHVNPAFFGRSSSSNGMGMMHGSGRDGRHPGVWGEASMSGWVGEEHERRTREATYGEDVAGSKYAHGSDMGYEKSRTSGARDKERVSDGDWAERRRRDDRDGDWEKEHHRERDGYRDQRERDRNRDHEWERERPARMRSKVRIAQEEEGEEEQWPQSREEDYGKRQHLAAER